MMLGSILSAADPVSAGTFLTWGPISISIGNFVVIVTMLVVFAAALVLPFIPDGSDDERPGA
jgi:high-affinity Fe2+/Pb2+ permease